MPPTNQVHRDIACTVCGCVCDDLKITVDDGRIVRADGACALAEPWFLQQETRHPAATEIDGREVSVDDAVIRAAEILRDAQYPLIYGLSRSSTPGQRAAIRLADRLSANVDTTASLCHAPSIMAIQQNGESTCSLGEIRNRADLVMFWGLILSPPGPRTARVPTRTRSRSGSGPRSTRSTASRVSTRPSPRSSTPSR